MKEYYYLIDRNRFISKHHWKIVIINFFIWLAIDCIPLPISYLIKSIFDSMQMRITNEYYHFCLLAECAIIVQSILIVVGGRIDTITRFDIRKNVTSIIIKKTITSRCRDKKSEMLVELLSNDVAAYEELISTEIDLICKVIFAIAAFAMLLKISISFTLLVGIPVLIINIAIIRLRGLFQKKYSTRRSADISYAEVVGNIFENRETIYYNSINASVLQEVEVKLETRKRYNIQNTIIEAAAEQISDTDSVLSTSVILAFVCLFTNSLKLTAGDFSLIIALTAYIGQYSGLFTECVECLQRLKNTEQLLRKCFGEDHLEYDEQVLYTDSEERVDNLDVHIYMHNEEIHLSASRGDFIVVCGPNGSGKSGFIDAIIGYREYKGSILVNGEKKKYLSNVAVSLQEPRFINESLADNMTYGQGGDISHSLGLVNLDKELQSYIASEMPLGINAGLLSSGQRQRLSISRVFQNNRDVMIFDDSTRLIDDKNVEVVLTNIYKLTKLGSITIFVSNDERVINLADKVLTIA